MRAQKLHLFFIFSTALVSSIFIGCHSKVNESTELVDTCSLAMREDYESVQLARSSNDSMKVVNSCAHFLSVHGSQSCQSLDPNGQALTIAYSQIEPVCRQARLKSSESQSRQVEARQLNDPKFKCSETSAQSYKKVASELTRFENQNESLPLLSLEQAALACDGAKIAFHEVDKCSAVISNKLRWISWKDLAQSCGRIQKRFEASSASRAEGAFTVNGGKVSFQELPEHFLIPEVPSDNESALRLRVRGGRDLTSAFAGSSDQMDIFYSKGLIVGQRASEALIERGQVVCGVTRNDVHLILHDEDQYFFKKMTVRAHEDQSDWLRWIIRFESPAKNIFWISCVSNRQQEATPLVVQATFGDLLELKNLRRPESAQRF